MFRMTHFKCLRNHPFPIVNVISLDEFAADMNETTKVYRIIDENKTLLNEPMVEYRRHGSNMSNSDE